MDIKPHNLLSTIEPSSTKAYCWLMFRVFMAEFIASGVVNLPPMLMEDEKKYESVVQGISMGAVYYVAIWIVYPVSGGHINPLISLILFATRRIQLFHLIIYWGAQLSGTIFFQMVGEYVSPFGENNTRYGMTMPGENVTSEQALALEVIISFFYIVVYLATIDDNRPDNWAMETGVNMALVLMLVYTTNIVIALPITGGSMNPFRSLGPAFLRANFEKQWIYVIGPFCGSILALLVHHFLLASPAWEPDRYYDPDAKTSAITGAS